MQTLAASVVRLGLPEFIQVARAVRRRGPPTPETEGAIADARAQLLRLLSTLREVATGARDPALSGPIEIRTPQELAELALAGAPVELIAECLQALEARDDDTVPVEILAL